MDVWFLFGSEDEGVKILVTSQDQKPQPQRLGFIGCAASHMAPASVGKVLQSQGCCWCSAPSLLPHSATFWLLRWVCSNIKKHLIRTYTCRRWAHDSRGGVHGSRQTAMVGTLLPHVWPQQFSLIEASTTCWLLYLSRLKKRKHLQAYAAKFCLVWCMATFFIYICVNFDLLVIFPVYKLKDYLGGILPPPLLTTPLFHFVFDRFFSPSI